MRTVDRSHVRAWYILVAALALHVADEALTDFLGFYNPTVLAVRSRLPWFPMPTFTFGPWLGGLIALVVVLLLIAPSVERGAPGTSLASWTLGIIMLLNGCGHLAGSVYVGRWLPGTTSAPVLVVASLWLMRSTALRARHA